jgi:two-component system CheB/CheR fusion protein
VRRDEATGRHLLSLDIGLPLEEVGPLVRGLLTGGSPAVSGVLAAVNRRGRQVLVTVTGSQLRDADVVTGAILVMDARDGVARDGAAQVGTARGHAASERGARVDQAV